MIPFPASGGAPAYYLADFKPDWSRRVELSVQVPSRVERGLTGREARLPLGATLRFPKLSYRVLLEGEQRIATLAAMQDPDLLRTRVTVPLWPAVAEGGASPLWLTGRFGTVNDDGVLNIYEDGDPVPGGEATLDRVPLLWCRLEKPPRIVALTDELLEADFTFTDAAEADEAVTFAPGVAAPVAGPVLGASALPTLSMTPDWAGGVEAGGAVLDADLRRIGERRDAALTLYPQTPARVVEVDLAGDIAEASALLRLFAEVQGAVGAFWMPTFIGRATLTANAAAGATTLAVTDAASFTAAPYAALAAPGRAPVVFKATGTGAGTITLASALAGAWTAADTALWDAVAARFAADRLDIRFTAPDSWEATVRVVEVPPEYGSPAGETAGETMGALPVPATLFTFTLEDPVAPVVVRATSHEADVTVGGHTYTSRHLESSEWRDTLMAEASQVTIRARAWDGCPLVELVTGLPEWPLRVVVAEATLTAGVWSTPVELYRGEVVKVAAEGPMLTATVAGLGAALERRWPRYLMQPSCNWSIFDAACGLDREDFTVPGTVAGSSGHDVTVTLGTPPPGVTVDANWFAGGYLEATVAGRRIVRGIVSSTAPSGGSVVLTLSVTAAVPNGTAVSMLPGCGGDYSRCAALGNDARFGGFPFMPAGNPSMPKAPENRNLK